MVRVQGCRAGWGQGFTLHQAHLDRAYVNVNSQWWRRSSSEGGSVFAKPLGATPARAPRYSPKADFRMTCEPKPPRSRRATSSPSNRRRHRAVRSRSVSKDPAYRVRARARRHLSTSSQMDHLPSTRSPSSSSSLCCVGSNEDAERHPFEGPWATTSRVRSRRT
jgi:hypothetical protein